MTHDGGVTSHADAKHRETIELLERAKVGLSPVDPIAYAEHGLSARQLQERRAAGLENGVPEDSSRTLGQILRSNLLTLFNVVLGTCLVIVLLLGRWQDALFGFILIANAAIGVIQEYRAKRALDRLAVLHAPHARVLRAGQIEEIEVSEIVYDDLLVLRIGDQIPADAVLVDTQGLEVDESLLTGESDPIDKAPGEDVLSGSAVVAGSGTARVHRIGIESFAARLTVEAKRFSLVNSEIRNAINRIVLYITWALIPIILLLVNSQVQANGGWSHALEDGVWQEATISAIAAIVAMIPEGLVLLTSISFALAAVGLARQQVLVQELPAVEGLARVDVVCLDKTGTLTEGEIAFESAHPLNEVTGWQRALGWIGADPGANATAAALTSAYTVAPRSEAERVVPFNSSRKWSGVSFGVPLDADDPADGSWVLGAPEMVLNADGADRTAVLERVNDLADRGLRVLLLAHTAELLDDEDHDRLPPRLVPVALLAFGERVRADAAETLDFFRAQDVSLRIISGDNPRTVEAVARAVGFPSTTHGYDARDLPEDIDELGELLERERVFGRVSPEQKKSMVLALQRRGHVVAMTGDGVNDALALKHAEIGIAMGSGSAATKAVSRLVLLDDQFSRLPGVVAEGRRVIANVERVASLFLTKTAQAITTSLIVSILLMQYPFLPRQLSVVSGLTIGIPALLLALLPNSRRYVPGMLRRTLAFSIPAGLIITGAIMAVYSITLGMPQADSATAHLDTARTGATMTILLLSLWVLSILARPLDRARIAIVASMLVLTVLVFTVPLSRELFALSLPSGTLLLIVLGAVVIGGALLEVLYRLLKSRGSVSEHE